MASTRIAVFLFILLGCVSCTSELPDNSRQQATQTATAVVSLLATPQTPDPLPATTIPLMAISPQPTLTNTPQRATLTPTGLGEQLTPTIVTTPALVTPPPGIIERVSVVNNNVEASGASSAASLTSDGKLVAFVSYAGNLVADDSSNDCSDFAGEPTSCADIFVRNLEANETERISVSNEGTPANADSGILYEQGSHVHISADGRFVTFSSYADNLIPDVPGGQVYVYDRETGQITLASQAQDGTPGNGQSSKPVLSADGRYVAFESEASNVVADDTNGAADIFVYDRQTGQTEQISVASDGTPASNASGAKFPPGISADGRWVVFASFASNLVADDTNEAIDVFVRDRETGETERVSIASDGSQASYTEGSISIIAAVAISANGRYIAFESEAHNLVENDTNGVGDIFVYDRQTSQTERVSVSSNGEPGNGLSLTPGISADGRFVAFASEASNLVEGDTNGARDVFVHDRQTGQTVRASVAGDGAEANQLSVSPALSGDGRWLAFASLADNLVPNDTNETWDIFIRDLSMLHQTE